MWKFLRLSLILSCLAIPTYVVAPQELDTLSIGTEIEVKPTTTEAEGSYSVSAVIFSIDKEEILAAPTIVFKKGSPAEAWSETANKDVVHFKIELSQSENELSYSVEILRKETVVARQRAAVRLTLASE